MTTPAPEYFTQDDFKRLEARTRAQMQTVALFPRRSIGPLIADVTVEEHHADELQITEHPIMDGGTISDHAYKKPSELAVKIGVSNSSSEESDRARKFYESVLELQAKREPFDIVTGKRLYSNMLVRGVSVSTDPKTENVLMAALTFREVIIVSTASVVIPSARMKNGKKTGKKLDKGGKQAKPVEKTATKKFLDAIGRATQ